MDAQAHHRIADELAAKAEEYLGQGDGQQTAAVWAAVAQVHATLALTEASGAGHGSQAAADSSQANATVTELGLRDRPPPGLVPGINDGPMPRPNNPI